MNPSLPPEPVQLGDLRRTTPIDPAFGLGLGRGRPIDRHYIEGFLERHREDVRFTPQSVERLRGERFDSLEVQGHGNVPAAIGFLHRLACEDLSKAELDAADDAFPMLLTVTRSSQGAERMRRRAVAVNPARPRSAPYRRGRPGRSMRAGCPASPAPPTRPLRGRR